MSNIMQRRWQTFQNNKPARIALWFFGIVFALSLCAEIIANDKPLLVRYKNATFFPFVQSLTEKDFGSSMDIRVNFHDPFIKEEINANGFAIWAPIRFSYNTIAYAQDIVFPAPPSRENILGTDDQGRDILARIIYGFRLSVLFGLCLAICSGVVGIFAGAVQGYYGGAVDLWFQRFMEIWGGIPVIYLLIIASSIMQMSFWLLLSVMLLFGWMRLVRVVRAETLRARNLEYVMAARALGVSELRIMVRHVLPNAMVAVFSRLPFQINSSIVALTSLDFLGFGLPIGYPSLGEIVAQGKNNLHAPWIGLTVFFTMSSMLASLVLIGEGLRDAFDPRVFLHQKQTKGQK